MKIQVGVGNSISAVFSAAAKTLAISGLSIADIEPGNLEIYNVTRSAYMLGGNSTATGTVARTLSSGLTVQTLTLSAIPTDSADGDSLVIFITLPDSVALYVAMAYVGVNTIPA